MSDAQAPEDLRPTALDPWPVVYLRAFPRVARFGLAAGIFTLLSTFLLPSRFAATISFVAASSPSNSLPSGGIAALASRFGIGGLTNSVPPEFYATLLTDRSILDPVIVDTFVTKSGERKTLLALLNAGGNTPARQIELAALKFTARTSTLVDDETNIVALTVSLPDPEVAAQVANLLVARLDTFNQTTRQTEARASRIFVEGRLEKARRDLAATEDSLRVFYTRNRRIEDSPSLLFEETRLKRLVDIQQSGFETLAQEYEQARIDEVRDTPVLTILQPAIVPTKRAWPRRGVSTVFGIVTGVLISLAWTTWVQLTQRDPAAATTGAAFRQLARDGMKHLRWRRPR